MRVRIKVEPSPPVKPVTLRIKTEPVPTATDADGMLVVRIRTQDADERHWGSPGKTRKRR